MSAKEARRFKAHFKAEITREIRRQAKNGATIEFIEKVVVSQFPSQRWIDWLKVADAEIEKRKALTEAH